MAKFYDPIQRWRHSKSCKKDAPTKGREGMSKNGKRELPPEVEYSFKYLLIRIRITVFSEI